MATQAKYLANTVNSDEINYLVFRYLQESGYVHAAFVFGYESQMCKTKIDGSQIPPGALLSFVQRGVNFVEIEESMGLAADAAGAPNHTVEGTVSLLDVHRSLCTPSFRSGGRTDRPARDGPGGAGAGDDAPRSGSRHAPSPTGLNAAAGADAANPAQGAPDGDGMDIESNGREQGNAMVDPSRGSGDGEGGGDTTAIARRLQIPAENVQLLRGHDSEVFVCAWNPRISILASGSGDSSARIWAIPQGPVPKSRADPGPPPLVLHHFPVESPTQARDPKIENRARKANDVTTMDWSSDGKLLATGSYDGCARIWTETGVLKHTLSLHKGPLFSLKWNKQGNYLLSGSVDKTTAVWDAAAGSCVKHFKVHSAPTLDVDWMNNTTFASCSTDKVIYVCSMDQKGPMKAFEGHKDEINCLRFDYTSSLLASCSDDTTAKIWSMNSSHPVFDLTEHTKEVYTLRWLPSQYRRLILATASFDATVKLWDINNGRCMQTLSNHTDPVYSLDFSPNGEMLASGSFDRSLCIWSVKDGVLLKKYRGNGGIFEVTWNSTGDKVAACFSNNTVAVLDCRMLQAQV